MWIRFYENARAFLKEARSFLLLDEPKNHLILGLAEELAGAEPGDDPTPFFVTVGQNRRVCACALQTPPLHLLVTSIAEHEAALLAEELAAREIDPPGVIGPAGAADVFSAAWSRARGVESRLGTRQRIYKLEAVETGLPTVPGGLRKAEVEDLEMITEWVGAFIEEVDMPLGTPRKIAEKRTAEGALYLWDDGEPVAMAAWAGPTPSGIRINLVYTPRRLRGRGWATAAVAALSQLLLDEGRKFCALYADLGNPASNRIYQRIGYRPVCDVHEFHFERSVDRS